VAASCAGSWASNVYDIALGLVVDFAEVVAALWTGAALAGTFQT
jgi:hypothetical protein